jgi:hypothetical protein
MQEKAESDELLDSLTTDYKTWSLLGNAIHKLDEEKVLLCLRDNKIIISDITCQEKLLDCVFINWYVRNIIGCMYTLNDYMDIEIDVIDRMKSMIKLLTDNGLNKDIPLSRNVKMYIEMVKNVLHKYTEHRVSIYKKYEKLITTYDENKEGIKNVIVKSMDELKLGEFVDDIIMPLFGEISLFKKMDSESNTYISFVNKYLEFAASAR